MSTISASTTTTTAYKVTADTTGTLVLQTGSTPTTAVTLDASQNMGLGVTPSAWRSTSKAFQINTTGGVSSDTTYGTSFSDNVFLNSSANWIRLTGNGTTTGLASVYGQANGVHYWYNAPVGSAGATATLTQAMTLDASGNLGLAIGSPTARLTIGLQSYTVSATSGMIRFKNDQNSADGCIQSYSVASNIGTDIVFGSNFYVDTAGQFARFNTGRESAFQIISRTGTVYWGTGGTGATATQALTLNQSGVLALKGGNDSANGVGIAFPSTQVASSDVNTLDDYEEGSWTPTDASGAGLTFGAATSARYTKIGRCVFIDCEVVYPSTVNNALASIGGLPFTSKNTTDYNSGTCMNDANLNIWSFINANTTGITLYSQATSFLQPTNAQLSTKSLYISIWYLTAY